MSKNPKYMYDLAVIGAGSGGVRAARIAAGHGAKVALIETSYHHGPPGYSAVGGTCVNVGCVPKKLMVYGSNFRKHYKQSAGYGWDPKPDSLGHSWQTLMEKKDAEIGRLNSVYTKMLSNAGVELLEGFGKFKDQHTVVVEGKDEQELTAETVLVAVGGWPFKPDIPGIEHAITSNEAFYLSERPDRLLVVGGGYIGVEFVSIFQGYGSDVTLAYRGDLFLRGFDLDIREHLAEEMKKAGTDVRFNVNPTKIEKLDSGAFKVTFDNGSTSEYDLVMYATGRKPKVSNLNLDKVGVKLNSNGSIAVDEWSKTNVENIYAVGDVTDRIQLTPVALNEGHCVADTLYGNNPRKIDHENVASAVFSQPEIATVGMTEEEAAKKYPNLRVYRSKFREMFYTLTGYDIKTLMKIIVDDDTDKVLGVHMCGKNAAEIIQGVAIAVKMGATKKDFDATVGIHPTSAEELVTMRTPAYRVKDGAKL